MPSRRVKRPDPPPLETDDVTLVAIGTSLWVIGLVVLLVLRVTDTAEVRDWWLAMCGYGIALGLFGVRYCRKRHLAIQRDKERGIAQRS